MDLTVGITTRNRPEDLIRAINSTSCLHPLDYEVIVLDDCSDTPVVEQIAGRVSKDVAPRLRVIRQVENLGYIVARNHCAREARGRYVLTLDDDAYLLDGDGIREAVALLDADATVAATAFAQADARGEPYNPLMQPAPVGYTCQVPTFFGYGNIQRRDLFNELGGYRALFHYYAEEKELSKRYLAAGYKVVYMPHVRVAHLFSQVGRVNFKHIRYTTRNGMLDAVYNEPLSRAAYTLPGHLVSYLRHCVKKWQLEGDADPGGLRWLAQELVTALPKAAKERRPLVKDTYREWRRLKREWPAYSAARS